jgi:hypothetical protein
MEAWNSNACDGLKWSQYLTFSRWSFAALVTIETNGSGDQYTFDCPGNAVLPNWLEAATTSELAEEVTEADILDMLGFEGESLELHFGILVMWLVLLHVAGFLSLKYNDSFPQLMP